MILYNLKKNTKYDLKDLATVYNNWLYQFESTYKFVKFNI